MTAPSRKDHEAYKAYQRAYYADHIACDADRMERRKIAARAWRLRRKLKGAKR